MLKNLFVKRKPDENKIDAKHNLCRIKTDLLWVYKDTKTPNLNFLISLYWLDINLKNALFPWTLKIERELKSLFIYFYKDFFKSDSFSFLLDENNYLTNPLYKDKITFTLYKINQLIHRKTNIDNLIFSMTFGEFVTLIIVFSDEIKKNYCEYLKIKKTVFLNLIKYCSIVRNLVAHNKTILNIIDERNNNRFSLKKDIFNFKINKEEIDILSTNIAGIICGFDYLITHIDFKKVPKFLDDIRKPFKTFKKFLSSNNEYKFVMKRFFLSYEKQIILYKYRNFINSK
ncbi:MAG: Abi family protein [Malacoplasma sp.]